MEDVDEEELPEDDHVDDLGMVLQDAGKVEVYDRGSQKIVVPKLQTGSQKSWYYTGNVFFE
jgi:hypothetical protein